MLFYGLHFSLTELACSRSARHGVPLSENPVCSISYLLMIIGIDVGMDPLVPQISRAGSLSTTFTGTRSWVEPDASSLLRLPLTHSSAPPLAAPRKGTERLGPGILKGISTGSAPSRFRGHPNWEARRRSSTSVQENLSALQALATWPRTATRTATSRLSWSRV